MKSWKLAILYGFLLWLIPFVVSIIIFPLRDTQRPFFETIMPVTLTLCVVALSVLYLRRVRTKVLAEAIKVGFVWLAISLALDLMMFMWGPMKMSFIDYMKDIGLTYLIFPIVTTGYGYLLRQRENHVTHTVA